jgi:hypothetical protein
VSYRESWWTRCLEEAEQFEHNHDDDNYSDYVEDASVHAVLISEWMCRGEHLRKPRRSKKDARVFVLLYWSLLILSHQSTWAALSIRCRRSDLLYLTLYTHHLVNGLRGFLEIQLEFV